MINLLPEAEKSEIGYDYRRGVWAVVLIFLLITAGMALVLMFPSYLVLSLEEKEVKSDLEKIDQRIKGQELSLNESRLKDLESKRAFLGAMETASTTANLIKEILNARKPGIKITNINYAEGGFSLQGVAERRTNLLEFIKALKSLPTYKEVNAPLSNLLSEKNVNFSLTLK